MTKSDDWPRELRSLSHRVLQAAGMVAVQGGYDVIEAFGRLKLHADAMGRGLEHTAVDVLDGVIRFDS